MRSGALVAPLFCIVPREHSEAAVDCILENLHTPAAFLPSDVLHNIAPYAVVNAVADQQRGLLDGLMGGRIYNLLQEQAILDPDKAYPLVDYLTDIRDGLFEELRSDSPEVDPLRRELQRRYLSTLTSQSGSYEEDSASGLAAALGGDSGLSCLLAEGQGTDLRAAANFNLSRLAVDVEAALSHTEDVETQAHLEDLQNTIEGILTGRVFMYDFDGGGTDLGSLFGG